MKDRVQAQARGQGLVELAAVLPLLLILLIGVVEMGFALRNYLVVVNAAREGARYAVKGEYTMAEAGLRTVLAAGVESENVPFLRTEGDSQNTGIIITRMEIDEAGNLGDPGFYIAGVIPKEGEEGETVMDYILPEDSRISTTQVLTRHWQQTMDINETRAVENLGPLGENIVVVEVFYAHHPLWNMPLLPLPDPWLMYSRAVMREAR
jgi:hypothetical protein